jgi:PAS domain S-box-containing protein
VIVAMVGAVVVALSSLYLRALFAIKLDDTIEIARVSAEQVKSYVLERVRQAGPEAPGASLEEAKRRWARLIRDDPHLPAFLIRTVASSAAVVEILISDDEGRVIASSNPAQADEPAPQMTPLIEWSRMSTSRKLWQLLGSLRDLELRVPLGAAPAGHAVFTIHVVLSTTLLRDAIVPELARLAALSAVCLLVSAGAAGLLARRAARPLEQVAAMIDQLAKGEGLAEPAPARQDSELEALQSKLALLGRQIRGASEHAAEMRGRLEQLLERLEEAILLFDRNGRLAIAGGATERFLGRGRWELIGAELEELFPPASPLGALVQAAATHRQRLRNHRLATRLPDGSETLLLVSVEVLEEFPARERRGLVVTLRDAESRRQLESEIDVSLRREAMGRLLSGVAHEIKNPLNSIYTHLQLLELEAREKAPELSAEIETIGSEIKRLDRMVVTLLDFTRPLELRREETDLVALAEEIAGLLAPVASERAVRLEVAAETPRAVVSADRSLLRQAVMNVVLNGIEAMDQPGSVEISIAPADSGYELRVRDQGRGIPPEIRDKIFNLYFTTKGRGSGIGLTMAWRIAELHGARLDFDSRPGEGTTFRFLFPAAAARAGTA